MKLLATLILGMLVGFCNASPARSRSLNLNIRSCPTNSIVFEEFQARSPCSVFCLDDSDCVADGLACCATSCGSQCVAESILRRTFQDDEEKVEKEQEAEIYDSNETRETQIDKQLKMLREKLYERREEVTSNEWMEDEDESEEESNGVDVLLPTMSLSSSEEDDDDEEDSYDVVTPTEGVSKLVTDGNDYSYSDEEEVLETLLMKLLYDLKVKQNAKKSQWDEIVHTRSLLEQNAPSDGHRQADFIENAMPRADALEEDVLNEDTRELEDPINGLFIDKPFRLDELKNQHGQRRSSMKKSDKDHGDNPVEGNGIVNHPNMMRRR